MQIKERRPQDLQPYENNARNNERAIDYVAESIKRYGFRVPIIVDENDVIIAGHTRHLAAMRLGLKTVPTIKADDLTPEQAAAFRLADNKTAEIAEWDREALEKEIAEIEQNLAAVGFGADVPVSTGFSPEFSDVFQAPPVSVIDGRTHAWKTRRQEWQARITAEHRGKDVTYDPCLAETLLRWFCAEGEAVLEPAGIPAIATVARALRREIAQPQEKGPVGLLLCNLDRRAPEGPENALWGNVERIWARSDARLGRKAHAVFVVTEPGGAIARCAGKAAADMGWQLKDKIVYLEDDTVASRAYLGFEDRRPFQAHRTVHVYARKA